MTDGYIFGISKKWGYSNGYIGYIPILWTLITFLFRKIGILQMVYYRDSLKNGHIKMAI